jgi:hypothetical protein
LFSNFSRRGLPPFSRRGSPQKIWVQPAPEAGFRVGRRGACTATLYAAMQCSNLLRRTTGFGNCAARLQGKETVLPYAALAGQSETSRRHQVCHPGSRGTRLSGNQRADCAMGPGPARCPRIAWPG